MVSLREMKCQTIFVKAMGSLFTNLNKVDVFVKSCRCVSVLTFFGGGSKLVF